MDNGEYALELADGRRMTYPAADVSEMKRLTEDTPEKPSASGVPLSGLCRGTTLFTEYALASDLYEHIKEVQVAQKGMGYGSGTKYYPDLAAEARKVGGDAVISVREWRAATAWSWSAPHVGGMAVRWTEKAKTEVVTIENKCF